MEAELKSANFSAPSETLFFDGILSDADGTLIDSTDAIVKHWHKLGKELGVDPEVILAASHVCAVEGRIPIEFGASAVEIPGARAIIDTLNRLDAPWAVVTSGTKPLIQGWLQVMRLAQPRHLVSAEDVSDGKPDPECFLQGYERLAKEQGWTPTGEKRRILVLEDSPSGIKAGKAAGYSVLGLATTHKISQLRAAGADWIVRDLRSLRLGTYDVNKGLETQILDALVV